MYDIILFFYIFYRGREHGNSLLYDEINII